ncbi:unnamed protein product [Dovyalis caffra]|uniref:Uncharacterized protein n=1 Tax=Dovyalis caffra TaxID=77055 RepID=A0AAV1RYL6_9ROSI|nr:unnamed protein product [Dovyalis caffra]
MAASSSAADPKLDLIKKVRSHEVAIAELSNLSSSRAVYQKNGNLFFRTTSQKATASEQNGKFNRRGFLQKIFPQYHPVSEVAIPSFELQIQDLCSKQ